VNKGLEWKKCAQYGIVCCRKVNFYIIENYNFLLQMNLAKKGPGPNSRIPLPTGRYFLNLSPSEIPPPRTPVHSNVRPPKSGGMRKASMERTLPLDSPSTYRGLTPVGQPGREILDIPKASATSLSHHQAKPTTIEANMNVNNNEL
jgi:hypothetical protein